MSNPQVTARDHLEDVRKFAAVMHLYMRDDPKLNRLIEGRETNPRMMVWSVLDTMDDFNQSPPPIGSLPIDKIPPSILKLGVVANVLEQVALLQTRNRLSFSDGGIQAQISDKSPELMSWIDRFANRYEEKKLRWKIMKNIEAAWGFGVSSEYSGLDFWYGDFGFTGTAQ